MPYQAFRIISECLFFIILFWEFFYDYLCFLHYYTFDCGKDNR